MVPHLFTNALIGTLSLVFDFVFMNSELFPEWLQHFLQHVRPTKNDPVLLILADHVSHCTLVAVVLCRENYVIILSLLLQRSHKLQPLDMELYGSQNAM
jgi:hypothetical protein